jgi:hypothetical protein
MMIWKKLPQTSTKRHLRIFRRSASRQRFRTAGKNFKYNYTLTDDVKESVSPEEIEVLKTMQKKEL